MPDRNRIGLDNPAFRGRLRQPITGSQRSFRPVSAHRPSKPGQFINNDVAVPVVPAPDVTLVPAQPYAKPAEERLQQTKVLARNAVARPQAPAYEQEQQTPIEPVLRFEPIAVSLPEKRSRMQVALVAMAVMVFFVGLFVSVITMQTNHNARTQVAALAQKTADDQGTGDVPSETKPSGINNYQVAPTLPKFIKIPTLSINARVKPMGVTSKNELQAPSNIYDTGWYNASAHPGDDGSTGAVLIDGHVHGPTLPGVFANLKKLKQGDSIQVVRGDNKVFAYTVIKIQDYDAQNLDLGIALASAQPGKPGLNLITCGGTYDHASAQYTKRTIVFAVLQS